MKSLKLEGFKVAPVANYLESRTCVLTNKECQISLAAPTESLCNYFYKNTDSDEVLFIHKGAGKLRTLLGNIDFKHGDYLVIPRGIIKLSLTMPIIVYLSLNPRALYILQNGIGIGLGNM